MGVYTPILFLENRLDIKIPIYEHPKAQASILRGNLKAVVETIHALKAALDSSQKKDIEGTSDLVQQLKINLSGSMAWGKKLQEKIMFLEGKSHTSVT